MELLIKQSKHILDDSDFISATNFLRMPGRSKRRGLPTISPSMNQNRYDQKSTYEKKNFAMTSLPARIKSRNRIMNNAGESDRDMDLDLCSLLLRETEIALKTISPMPRYSFIDRLSARNNDAKRSTKRGDR